MISIKESLPLPEQKIFTFQIKDILDAQSQYVPKKSQYDFPKISDWRLPWRWYNKSVKWCCVFSQISSSSLQQRVGSGGSWLEVLEDFLLHLDGKLCLALCWSCHFRLEVCVLMTKQWLKYLNPFWRRWWYWWWWCKLWYQWGFHIDNDDDMI